MHFVSFQDLFNIIMLVCKKNKVIVYSKAFKYLRHKKVFIDKKKSKNTGFSDMKKLQKVTEI